MLHTHSNPYGKHSKKASTRHAITLKATIVMALGLALIPSSGIIVSTGLEYGRNLVMDVQADTIRQAESFASIQELITESTRRLLSTLSALPGFRSMDIAHISDILKAVHSDNPEYINFSLVDQNGMVIASSLLPDGIDLSERLHVLAAQRDGIFVPGEYVVALVDKTPSFAYGHPIRDEDGRIIATLTAVYRLSSYTALFERLLPADDSILGLVDRNGRRLYFHPPKDTNPLGGPINNTVWQAMLHNGDSGAIEDSGSDGIERFYAYRTLRINSSSEPYMYVVFGTPSDKARRINNLILIRSLVLMAVASGLAFAIVGLLSGRIIGRRLSLILEATERIAEGNFSQKVGFGEEESEMGRVAKALDSMADAVYEREQARNATAKNLEAALIEKNILLKEVHHRVKNNLQIILSLFSLEQDTGGNPEDYINAMERRVESMAMVHEMLYQTDDIGIINLGDYTKRLVQMVSSSMRDERNIVITVEAQSLTSCIDVAIPFGLLLNELLTNSYKHAFFEGRRGTITVNLKTIDDMAILEVKDDGPGLPRGFSISPGSGLGLRLVLGLSEQLRGTLSWESENGACFRVRFPLAELCNKDKPR